MKSIADIFYLPITYTTIILQNADLSMPYFWYSDPFLWLNNTILSNDVDNKYTDGIVSKHTDNSDEPKTPFDFYPTTLHGGDKKTLLPVKEGDSLSSINETLGGETYDEIAEGTKNGMPFYFKDLRTNPGTYVIFRGYLEGGITQELAPNWSEHQYLGRSESVYVYGNTKTRV